MRWGREIERVLGEREREMAAERGESEVWGEDGRREIERVVGEQEREIETERGESKVWGGDGRRERGGGRG